LRLQSVGTRYQGGVPRRHRILVVFGGLESRKSFGEKSQGTDLEKRGQCSKEERKNLSQLDGEELSTISGRGGVVELAEWRRWWERQQKRRISWKRNQRLGRGWAWALLFGRSFPFRWLPGAWARKCLKGLALVWLWQAGRVDWAVPFLSSRRSLRLILGPNDSSKAQSME
jgi:hypothetical protein